MLKTILLVVSVLALARAQVPSLGFCPEYVPMTNFDMGKFLGIWYEAEKSLQLPEFGSRCAMASYTKGADNKYHVSNIIGRILGFQRVIEGEIILPSSKADEGKLNFRYSTSLSNLPPVVNMLDTDYKTHAVMWSCNSLGPVHTENVWIMTRDRQPSSETLQRAYGVLDKFKISKSYLVRSDQTDCRYTGFDDLPTQQNVGGQEETPVDEEAAVGEEPDRLRSAIIPNESENDGEKLENAESGAIKSGPVTKEATNAATIEDNKEDKLPLPSTLAEVILKAADNAKENIAEESKKNKGEGAAVIPTKVEPAVVAVEQTKKPLDAPKKEQHQLEKKIKN